MAWHSSLSSQQESSIERYQSVCLRIILQESYISYEAALEMTGLEKLAIRRTQRCIKFSKKCSEHTINKRFFPQNVQQIIEVWNKEKFKVNFAHMAKYKNSAIPYCQRLLNQLEEERREEERRGRERRRGEEEGGGEEEELWSIVVHPFQINPTNNNNNLFEEKKHTCLLRKNC